MDEIDKLLFEDEMETIILVKHPKKKLGRRTTGKYKCRGKHQNRDVY